MDNPAVIRRGAAGMGEVTIRQMADRVSALLHERLGLRGATLQEQLRKGGRRLPRRVRDAAEGLAAAAVKAENPKLLAQIDESLVAEAYDVCMRHLRRLKHRNGHPLVRALTSAALSVLLVVTAYVIFLLWRGFD